MEEYLNEKEPQEDNNESIEYFLLIIGSILCFVRLLLGLIINEAFLFAGEKSKENKEKCRNYT